MARSYVSMTPAELERALRRTGVVVWCKIKTSALGRAPKRPHNVRFPGPKSTWTAVDTGIVTGVIGGKMKYEDEHGFGDWLDVEDARYLVDEL